MRQAGPSWMAVATLSIAAVFLGCSSSSEESRDGAALGTSYACVGGVVGTDAGLVPASPDASPPATCVVGQSYCSVGSETDVVYVPPTRTCEPLTGGLSPCAETPTCACLCGKGVSCHLNCTCDDSGGLVTVSCTQI